MGAGFPSGRTSGSSRFSSGAVARRSGSTTLESASPASRFRLEMEGIDVRLDQKFRSARKLATKEARDSLLSILSVSGASAVGPAPRQAEGKWGNSAGCEQRPEDVLVVWRQ